MLINIELNKHLKDKRDKSQERVKFKDKENGDKEKNSKVKLVFLGCPKDAEQCKKKITWRGLRSLGKRGSLGMQEGRIREVGENPAAWGKLYVFFSTIKQSCDMVW